MSSIGGFFGFARPDEEKKALLEAMNQAQTDRGPEVQGYFYQEDMGITAGGHGHRPFIFHTGGHSFAAALDGEFYNRRELREDLERQGEQLNTSSDEELALKLYLVYGSEFIRKVNGVFALAIADAPARRLLLYRDRIGAKPLFWARRHDTLYFSSLLAGLLACPEVEPVIDWGGLNEIFSIGPARTPGNGVFQDVSELQAAHYLICTPDDQHTVCYWNLASHPHQDDYETTVEHVTELVLDAITLQTENPDPVCTFLSGGLDSSLVSSVCAGILKKQGRQLHTYSFDFKDNDKYFKSNDFQPSRDRPYVETMVNYLDSDHRYLECDSETQLALLSASVRAANLPVMADIDSSLLYFCSQVAGSHSVALTGECADEIFCGYPWYHKKELLEADTFPWTRDLVARKVLLADDFLRALSMEDYVKARYEESLNQVSLSPEDTPEEARRRNIAWLNLKWFMQTLLNRMARTSSVCGLTARVPFADRRILESLRNIPWDMKARNGVVKNLLRESGKGLLPDEILYRRKSPYPKTYVPHYETMLAGKLRELLDSSQEPLNRFLDREKTLRFLESPSDYGRPWYGQLMAAPQMMAYMLQVNDWLKTYHIDIQMH